MEKPANIAGATQSTMSLEQIIARLIGPAETGEGGPRPLSPAERRALSQRLRAIVDDDAAERGAEAPDRGPAADALKLAAYLDGGMSASERDAFEAELVRSPARRDDLIAAVAWIEQISAQQEMPPADATALAIALERRKRRPRLRSIRRRIRRLDRMAAAAPAIGHRNLGAGDRSPSSRSASTSRSTPVRSSGR